MRRLFIAICALLQLSTIAGYAANTPPNFDPARFAELQAKLLKHGTPMDAGDRELRVFSSIEPSDKTKPHKAEYLSTLGYRDSRGEYVPYELSSVVEDWRKRENGDWEIEQWISAISMIGELKSVYHGRLVEKEDGTVVEIETLPSGRPSDPAELERWGAKLADWYERTKHLPNQ